ncbi:hypothetical protein EMIT0P176_40107 [Pseudomonas sp. IT-P176]
MLRQKSGFRRLGQWGITLYEISEMRGQLLSRSSQLAGNGGPRLSSAGAVTEQPAQRLRASFEQHSSVGARALRP